MNSNSEIVAIVGTLNGIILSYLAWQIKTLGKKLEGMVSDSHCKERQDGCRYAACQRMACIEENNKDLWVAVNCHTHEGLPREGGRVIRTKAD